ncbi:hypothetical protein PspLS_00191 [Pyricularia sp. CBS 133598]|nr:hypothetical protein PspLS_00191 [Pyricularia sp. CBS 133598]
MVTVDRAALPMVTVDRAALLMVTVDRAALLMVTVDRAAFLTTTVERAHAGGNLLAFRQYLLSDEAKVGVGIGVSKVTPFRFEAEETSAEDLKASESHPTLQGILG